MRVYVVCCVGVLSSVLRPDCGRDARYRNFRGAVLLSSDRT